MAVAVRQVHALKRQPTVRQVHALKGQPKRDVGVSGYDPVF
jgi:hypothetical protein